ncbi:hypothetical protein SK128_002105 [Halocaridina rubra]|uniref:Uncharacterized protein n=1 Tax=Halocaridina rubra TaxID=373956 RepID=A0AAN8WQL1_HALRR
MVPEHDPLLATHHSTMSKEAEVPPEQIEPVDLSVKTKADCQPQSRSVFNNVQPLPRAPFVSPAIDHRLQGDKRTWSPDRSSHVATSSLKLQGSQISGTNPLKIRRPEDYLQSHQKLKKPDSNVLSPVLQGQVSFDKVQKTSVTEHNSIQNQVERLSSSDSQVNILPVGDKLPGTQEKPLQLQIERVVPKVTCKNGAKETVAVTTSQNVV